MMQTKNTYLHIFYILAVSASLVQSAPHLQPILPLLQSKTYTVDSSFDDIVEACAMVVLLCLIDPFLNVSFLSSSNVLMACVDRAVPIALSIPFSAICTCIFSLIPVLNVSHFRRQRKSSTRPIFVSCYKCSYLSLRPMKVGLKSILNLIKGA